MTAKGIAPREIGDEVREVWSKKRIDFSSRGVSNFVAFPPWPRHQDLCPVNSTALTLPVTSYSHGRQILPSFGVQIDDRSKTGMFNPFLHFLKIPSLSPHEQCGVLRGFPRSRGYLLSGFPQVEVPAWTDWRLGIPRGRRSTEVPSSPMIDPGSR